MVFKRITSLLTFLLTLNLILAQFSSGLRTGIAIEKEVHKKFEIQFEEQVRLENNFQDFDRLITEIGGKYKVNKYYRIGSSYRFSFFEGSNLGHRISIYNQLRYKVEDFTFSYRLLFHSDFKNDRNFVSHKLRNKLSVNYKINKKWNVNIGGELFYSMNYEQRLFDTFRTRAGFDYKINKHNYISGGLIYDQEFNVEAAGSELIVNLGYTYVF